MQPRGVAEGLQDLVGHTKDILKGLRELKKSSAVAFEMLQVFSEEHDNSAVSFFTQISVPRN